MGALEYLVPPAMSGLRRATRLNLGRCRGLLLRIFFGRNHFQLHALPPVLFDVHLRTAAFVDLHAVRIAKVKALPRFPCEQLEVSGRKSQARVSPQCVWALR